MFHWTIEKGILIVSSANKMMFENSLRRYTNIFSHISWYSRCMNDALIVVWSESYSTNTFCFFNTCSLQRIGKILNEGFNLLQTIEWLAVQNWGSSHKDEQDKWAKPVFEECNEDIKRYQWKLIWESKLNWVTFE